MPDVQSWVAVSLLDVQGVSRTERTEPRTLQLPGEGAEDQAAIADDVVQRPDPAECRTCGDAPGRLVAGECRNCYQYRYRHGVSRPEALIVSHGRRILERELSRRFVRIA